MGKGELEGASERKTDLAPGTPDQPVEEDREEGEHREDRGQRGRNGEVGLQGVDRATLDARPAAATLGDAVLLLC